MRRVLANTLLAFATLNAGALAAPPDELELYLDSVGMDRYVETHLLDLVRHTTGPDRLSTAERLGERYAAQLALEPTPELLARSRELLELIPDGDLLDLRMRLAVGLYESAEMKSDRAVLSMTEPEPGAIQNLERAYAALIDIAARASRDARVLDRDQRRASADKEDAARLASAHRTHSTARFYAGWSGVHLARLTGERAPAADAIDQFAYVLNLPNQPVTIDRMPRRLLEFEHVTRAACGVAMSWSMLGRHRDASELLGLILESDRTPPGLDSLFQRTSIEVDANAGAWDRLTLRASRWDARTQSGIWRLLCVSAIEARERGDNARGVSRAYTLGLDRLLRMGEASQAARLASHPRAPGGIGTGLVGRYAAALAAREHADALRASADPSDEVAYEQAALAYLRALESPATPGDADLRARCHLGRGICLVLAGKPAEAQRPLARVLTSDIPDVRKEAVWWSLAASDASGAQHNAESLEMAREYLRLDPGSERSARLLLSTADHGVLPRDELRTAVNTAFVSASPEMRSRLPDLLYRMYRRAPRPERGDAAADFLREAAPALRRASADGTVEETLARQILDVVLENEGTDIELARSAISAVRRAGPPGHRAEELAYRELQLAIRQDDIELARSTADSLIGGDGSFARSAARLMYQRAADAWRHGGRSEPVARDVLRSGAALLRLEVHEHASPLGRALREEIALAASWLWSNTGDRDALEQGYALDLNALESESPTTGQLTRLGHAGVEMGEPGVALDAWLRLMSGLAPPDPRWYEARLRSIELLADTEPVRAIEALRQHRVLHPEPEPAPWMAMFVRLESSLLADLPASEGSGGDG